jgi:hypothetical protein
MIWTRQDEMKLRQARGAVAELQGRRSEALRSLADALRFAGIKEGNIELLIGHADAIRDALEPFDSGVRLADEAAPVRGPAPVLSATELHRREFISSANPGRTA